MTISIVVALVVLVTVTRLFSNLVLHSSLLSSRMESSVIIVSLSSGSSMYMCVCIAGCSICCIVHIGHVSLIFQHMHVAMC